jgi:hypothetical protein
MTTPDEKGKTMTIKSEVTREPVKGAVVTRLKLEVRSAGRRRRAVLSGGVT